IRDNVMEALSGIKGDNSIKIFGPELDQLETLAIRAKNTLQDIEGIENVGVFHIRGQSHLEFRVDPEKCEKWGVTTADVNNLVSGARGGKRLSGRVEGEKLSDTATRGPNWRRASETAILAPPVDILNTQVLPATDQGPAPFPPGTSVAPPAVTGTTADTRN